MTPRYDVVIAGAGPAGAASALRLARQGLRVALVDRAEFPREKVCSEYMSPEGVRHLATLGVLDAIERQGGYAIRGTTVHAPRGSRLTGLFARASRIPFRETGLSVARRILDHALVEAARGAGVDLFENTAVESVVYRDRAIAGLTVRDRAGVARALFGRLTIGADGLRSVVARALGGRRTGRLQRYALVAHLDDVAGLGEVAELHVSPQGYVGINPLGNGVANVALVVPRGLMRASRGQARSFFFQELQRFAGVAARVARARLLRDVLVTGPFASWSSRVVADGALLVGDAADFFDPFTGEGICAALKGAELLESPVLDALTRGTGLPGSAALRPYARARRREFLGKWIVERLIGYTMLAPGLFDRAVARLDRRGLAHTLIGVTGDFVPASAVLNPVFLTRVML